MGSNTFGTQFKIMTWGESHGPALGVVIDGCPAGLEINEAIINSELEKRAPGKNAFVSPRKESDQAQILSGVFDGKTTGTPISLLIPNHDSDSSKYESLKNLYRPGHANFTYLQKYGIFDYRGGGRASARETVCRVAAGAVARQFLASQGIELFAYLQQLGPIQETDFQDFYSLKQKKQRDPLNQTMIEYLEQIKLKKDSVGGVVEFIAQGVPVGLGEPVYEKLEAKLAFAMLSLPATKGFEIGSGFKSVSMHGSEHNDLFIYEKGEVQTTSNHAGGTLGGISTGMPIIGRVAFKPTSSIDQTQKTINLQGKETTMRLPEGSRHDPCVAIRAVPVVEAMLALVLADLVLLNRCVKL